jgi:hypothetical protein
VSSLEAVTALVPFLRARHGPAVPGDLLAADLIADPDRLAAEIAATAGGRQSDDPQVLASCGGRRTRTASPAPRWRPGW